METQFKTELESITKEVEETVKSVFEKELEKIIHDGTSETLEVLYYLPREYIKMVIKGLSKGLLLYGGFGLGKSYSVKRMIAESELKSDQYIFIRGHCTPLQVYQQLYHNREKLVIFDDVNILESPIILNILKSALDGGIVDYHTSMDIGIPSVFSFSGKIIILLNDLPRTSESLGAVESRILSYHLEMRHGQKIATLYEIARHPYKDIPLDKRIEIVNWIESKTNDGTKNLNIRLLFCCYEFYNHNSSAWKVLAEPYIQNDEYITWILQGISIEDWQVKTGLGRSSYYKCRQDLKKRGVRIKKSKNPVDSICPSLNRTPNQPNQSISKEIPMQTTGEAGKSLEPMMEGVVSHVSAPSLCLIEQKGGADDG